MIRKIVFKHCNVAGTPNLPQERRRFFEAGDDVQISLRETRREQPFGNRLRVLLAHENGNIRVAADFRPNSRLNAASCPPNSTIPGVMMMRRAWNAPSTFTAASAPSGWN